MTPDAIAFTMACISEFAAVDLESCAFLCIKRRAWALRDFTMAGTAAGVRALFRPAGVLPVLVSHIHVIHPCCFNNQPPVHFSAFSFESDSKNGGSQRTVLDFFLLPGICYHSSKVRNILLVSFSVSSSLKYRRPVLFNNRSIVEIDLIKERHHSEYVCSRKGGHAAKLCL